MLVRIRSAPCTKVQKWVDLTGVPPEALDRPCSDDPHLKKLALKLTRWKEVALYLNLDDGEIEAVEAAVKAEKVRARSLKMLRKWRNKFGENATYRCIGSAYHMPASILGAVPGGGGGGYDTHDNSVRCREFTITSVLSRPSPPRSEPSCPPRMASIRSFSHTC